MCKHYEFVMDELVVSTLLKYIGLFATHTSPCVDFKTLFKIIYGCILLWKLVI